VTAIVSDSSPLICLVFLRQEGLLKDMFGSVLIPPTVAEEVSRPHGPVAAIDAAAIPGLKIQSPKNVGSVAGQFPALHRGEIEAIALSLETSADLLIIDEAPGRLAARKLGIAITGTIGLLLRAKQEGRIPALRPLIESLRDRLQFRVSDSLVRGIRLRGRDRRCASLTSSQQWRSSPHFRSPRRGTMSG
jgi:uncharacterized protein